MRTAGLLAAVFAAFLVSSLSAQLTPRANPDEPIPGVFVEEMEDGTIIAVGPTGAYTFGSWRSYVNSQFFADNGMKCGVRAPHLHDQNGYLSTTDCSSSFTNPANQYDPTVAMYEVPVVVHILQAPNGSGAISDALVHSQIDVLNEDFLALSGTPGGSGTDVQVTFRLATVDPNGNPTTGINRYTSNQWYNDSGNYAAQIGWDTNRYLNIYTNTAGGNLGYAYVPSGGGVVGSSFDGVRILWSAFGRDAPIGPPYDQGRTTTHEVGHYLGLYHTFQGGCASASGCASNGDLICDTNPEGSPNYSGCSRVTCGSQDPVKNYMDYSEDLCMAEFTPDQARRMRCTIENFRVDLASTGGPGGNTAPSVSISSPANGTTVDEGTSLTFSASANDAEDGNISSSIQWSSDLDGNLGSGGSVSATLSVGTHTVTAGVSDSGGLSASDSITVTIDEVSTGNTAPSVSISSPANGTTVDEGTGLTFSASASDAEDGNISGSVQWSSDLDGNLGGGASISTSSLSVGTHTVTASVTDSGGLSASDTVSVTVESVSSGGFVVSGTSDKVKGRIFVDLTWSGAVGTSVTVFRDGQAVATTANDGAYTDATGYKGSGTITYVLTDDNGSSNTINVGY